MSSLQAANNVEAVTQAQKLLESLSWEGGYCPFSQHLLALNAHALLRLQRSAPLACPLSVCAVLCCAVLCCAVLSRAVLCCAESC